jgi:phosphatidyl-myo-inositol dimannoside synthase
MRVLLLAPPMNKPGGIQRYTEMLERALKELLSAEHVRCVVTGASHTSSGALATATKLQFVAHSARETMRFNPDLIICTHLALAPLGGLLARLRLKPYWVVVHGIEAWRPLPSWKRQALYHADRVLATSCFNREQVIRQQRLRPERTSRLPCAVDDRLLSIKPDANGRHSYLGEGRRLVLSVARLAAAERYKGHEVVLRALPSVVAQIPRLAYVIVGDGDDRPRLEELADQLQVRSNVVFTGEVTEAELAALYRFSQVFVLPARTVIDASESKGEGFGIVYLEAMAFGLPVIGPNYGAPAEIIQDGETGLLVDPEDPGAVSKALLRLLSAPEAARRMGAAGSEWVRREYSYSSFQNHLQRNLREYLNVD